jgi:hypothetical protein
MYRDWDGANIVGIYLNEEKAKIALEHLDPEWHNLEEFETEDE